MTSLMKKLLFCGAKSFPTELPEGHIWLWVGVDEERQRRFELNANCLNHPLIGDLLRHSEDELGYSYMGALRIACDAELFLHLLDLLRSGNPSVHYMELQDIMDRFYATSGSQYRCNQNYHRHHRHCRQPVTTAMGS